MQNDSHQKTDEAQIKELLCLPYISTKALYEQQKTALHKGVTLRAKIKTEYIPLLFTTSRSDETLTIYNCLLVKFFRRALRRILTTSRQILASDYTVRTGLLSFDTLTFFSDDNVEFALKTDHKNILITSGAKDGQIAPEIIATAFSIRKKANEYIELKITLKSSGKMREQFETIGQISCPELVAHRIKATALDGLSFRDSAPEKVIELRRQAIMDLSIGDIFIYEQRVIGLSNVTFWYRSVKDCLKISDRNTSHYLKELQRTNQMISSGLINIGTLE